MNLRIICSIDLSPVHSDHGQAECKKMRIEQTCPFQCLPSCLELHLLLLLPFFLGSSPDNRGRRVNVPRLEHKFCFHLYLKCLSLSSNLKAEWNGNLDHVSSHSVLLNASANLIQPLQIEPFFVTFAVYDAKKSLNISENFHVN